MLTDIHLQNFRSYKDQSFEFKPGVNIIVGPNASGKTNLLESILVLSRGKSYRVGHSDLIRINSNWLKIESRLTVGGYRSIKLEKNGIHSKTYTINGKDFHLITESNKLPVVLFEPTHLQLFSGGPERRREYVDNLIEQTITGYSKLRNQYKRSLLQRNHLLKRPKLNQSELFPWDIRLSQIAGQVVRLRHELIDNLKAEIEILYQELSESKINLELIYSSQWPKNIYENKLVEELDKNFEKDRARGFTGSGPHRDDLQINIQQQSLQNVASRGETRTVLLALKILELRLVEKAKNMKPILLLDDVFGELDGKRRHALTEYLKDHQTFITTTDADLIVEHFIQSHNVIALDQPG